MGGGGSSSSGLLSESLIWTYIIQLTSALRHVHSSGLACRTLEPSKILVVNKTRLLTKLSTVVDRAELNGDYSWSEYGDRYMLKLFRDYVFHQVMEDSRPWLDMSHIVSCPNKMDAGAMERVCLMSRDEQNVIVVSYAELKHCLEQSFAECVSATKYQMT